MARLRGYDSVVFRDARGNVITEKNFEQRGPDGGIDLIIDITSKTKGAAKKVETQVLKIIDEQIAQ